jgi:L-asparaginase II
MTSAAAAPVLVEVTRSGVVESIHRGSAVLLGPDGTVVRAAGDPVAPCYPRSANKAMQATAMVRLGLDLPDRLLALAAASHSGERVHLDAVGEILASAGLTPSDLGNAPGLPLDRRAEHELVRHGGGASALAHNCSGKHAAMLATCARRGWSSSGYLDPSHPLQEAITAVIAELSDEPVAGIGVDGCGAPAHRLSLMGLARAHREVVGSRVGAAMRAHPEMVGGSGRDVTRLMLAVPGLVAKDGAEGVFVAATLSGWAFAMKLDDGAWRGRVATAVTWLGAAGVDVGEAVRQGLDREPVPGGGTVVGEVRALG